VIAIAMVNAREVEECFAEESRTEASPVHELFPDLSVLVVADVDLDLVPFPLSLWVAHRLPRVDFHEIGKRLR